MRRQASREVERETDELATKEHRKHKDTEKNGLFFSFLFGFFVFFRG